MIDNQVDFTRLYDLNNNKYTNKQLISLKCIIVDLKTTEAKNKQLTTFKALDIDNNLLIQAEFWNFNNTIVNNSISEIHYCILNSNKTKIINNDWPTRVMFITSLQYKVTNLIDYFNISQENTQYIKVTSFDQIFNNKDTNDFSIKGNYLLIFVNCIYF